MYLSSYHKKAFQFFIFLSIILSFVMKQKKIEMLFYDKKKDT